MNPLELAAAYQTTPWHLVPGCAFFRQREARRPKRCQLKQQTNESQLLGKFGQVHLTSEQAWNHHNNNNDNNSSKNRNKNKDKKNKDKGNKKKKMMKKKKEMNKKQQLTTIDFSNNSHHHHHHHHRHHHHHHRHHHHHHRHRHRHHHHHHHQCQALWCRSYHLPLHGIRIPASQDSANKWELKRCICDTSGDQLLQPEVISVIYILN